MVSLSRIFATQRRTIAVGSMVVLTLIGVAAMDMMTINRSLHKQEQTIQHLDKKNVELNGTIKDKQEVKQEKQEEVKTLEQQHNDIEAERQRLTQEAA